jgi:ubiquinone/menaquinone biosynthesis C-methylase UbiE
MSKIRNSWNKISEHYVSNYNISTEIIHYGPLCPGEDKLQLLGDLKGLRVIELGCGAGQNSIALARAGARVTALDFAESQLDKGRALAQKEKIDIEFIARDISDLSPYDDSSFDLGFSSCTISFVEDIVKTFAEAFRVLVPGGRFVLCDMHPLQYILDEIDGGVKFNHPYPSDKPITMRWSWDFEARNGQKKLSAGFMHYVRPLSAYHNALVDAGFAVERILEPKSTLDTPHLGFSKEIWREYRYIAKNLPITYILLCRKPK